MRWINPHRDQKSCVRQSIDRRSGQPHRGIERHWRQYSVLTLGHSFLARKDFKDWLNVRTVYCHNGHLRLLPCKSMVTADDQCCRLWQYAAIVAAQGLQPEFVRTLAMRRREPCQDIMARLTYPAAQFSAGNQSRRSFRW